MSQKPFSPSPCFNKALVSRPVWVGARSFCQTYGVGTLPGAGYLVFPQDLSHPQEECGLKDVMQRSPLPSGARSLPQTNWTEKTCLHVEAKEHDGDRVIGGGGRHIPDEVQPIPVAFDSSNVSGVTAVKRLSNVEFFSSEKNTILFAGADLRLLRRFLDLL